ncbi:MAG: nitrous oxide reductase family maturation protein NosD [Gemmatimonadales bacterium]
MTRPAVLAFLAVLAAPPARAQQVTVEPGGPVSSVRHALDLARPGDRILIRAGVYRESTLVVTRRVEIAGEPDAVIDFGGVQGFLIRGDSVVVRGLQLRNVASSSMEDRSAVKVIGGADCEISDNAIDNAFFGVYIAASHGCRVLRNRITGSGTGEGVNGNAIHLWNDTAVVVTGNIVTGHRDGIYLEFNRLARISGNESRGNNRYGLHFMFSDSCLYRENTFAENGAGVAVMYSRHVTMTGNRFADNWGGASYGLLLKEILDSRVDGNDFVHNTVGVYMEGSNRLRFTGNTFERNGWAVRLLADASDNAFHHNRFVSNSFDVGTNSRNTEGDFHENFWDHYDGYDLDRDGYGDVPYRPVRLFSLVVQQHEPALILMRSFFIDLLDVAERVLPVLTPEALSDRKPLMRWTP